jgi:zinc D-Ala-D-Ala carboxypeptidase
MRIRLRRGNARRDEVEAMSATSVVANRPRRRIRPFAIVIVLAVGAMVAGIVWAASPGSSSSAGAGVPRAAGLSEVAMDGVIESSALLTDTALPAIANLDPALYDALVQASIVAASDRILLEVTSGWRSRAYQERLFSDAVVAYGSAEAARQWVATPDTSTHVTGHAVDIGPVDAQFWLIEHGAQWGLCQIYANERWHFELATTPGGTCPEMKADAAG